MRHPLVPHPASSSPAARAILVILVVLTLVGAAGRPAVAQPPGPAEARAGADAGTPAPIPPARPPLPASTPIPGPSEQPGLFASGPELTQRSPTGPFLRGDDGTLAVVGVYPADSGDQVLVALRNLTGNTVLSAEVAATLPGATEDDAPVALGITTDIVPSTIVPDGLAFALVPLAGADGAIDADSLPRVDARDVPTDRRARAELRVVSATADGTDVIAPFVVESGLVPALSAVAVCVGIVDTNALGVTGWAASEVDYNVPLETGDSDTIRLRAPIGCDGPVLVALAGR